MKEFHAKHKHHIRLWILLALLTTVSGYVGYGRSSTPKPEAGNQKSEITQGNESVVQKTPNDQEIVYTSVDKQTKFEETTEAVFVPITLVIGEAEYIVPTPPDSTVYALMETAQRSGVLQFSSKNFGGDLGYLIEEINGVKNSVRDKKYWIYYINGKKAAVGVSNYKPQTNDTISWKYEDEE